MYTGGRGGGDGQFDKPSGIAYARDGTVLVADTGNDRIERFSSDGNLVGTIGDAGSGRERLSRPTGVAVDARGHVYVADSAGGRLVEFDEHGALAGARLDRDAGLVEPADVATDDRDRVFLLDGGAGKVVRLQSDGTVTSWGGVGAEDGFLRDPTGLAVYGDHVVVADAGNARVVVFSTDGTFERSWPVPEWKDLNGGRPDVTADRNGTIWLSSPATNSMLVQHSDGSEVGKLEPRDADKLDGPAGLALAPGGAMFVVNRAGDRISLLTQINP